MTSVAGEDDPGLVASFFALSGAGFADPPRNSFIERCEAAAHDDFQRHARAQRQLPGEGELDVVGLIRAV